jgi:putative ABC transport system permease protein
VLGLSPARGRDFDAALDGHVGAPHELIVSYALWQRRFNADPSIIGRIIDVDREPWTIIGVGPSGFRGLSGQADILLPAMTEPPVRLGPQWYPFWLVARRAPGVTVQQAVAATTALGVRVAEAFPNPMGKVNWEVTASPLDDLRLDPLIKRSLLVLFGAVAFVLLIACVNVANLLLGRASARSREIAVRVAIGAGRARIVRLLLTESLMLALAGAVAGVAVAWVGVHTLGSIDGLALSDASTSAAKRLGAVALSSINLDGRTLAFTLVVSLIVGVLFGLAPAVGAARESVIGALKSDPRSRRAGAGRRTLVVAEVALALVLLVGSGLMIRSLAKLLATDAGFDATDVLTFRLTLPPGAVARDSMPGFYSEILDHVRAVPGVRDAALDSCVPMGGLCGQWFFSRPGAPAGDMSSLVGVDWVTPNWFSLMHVPLERGRMLTAGDRTGAPQVVLLNASAAKKFFGAEDPIGKHVALSVGGITDAEVIGIVGGVRQRPDSTPAPVAYVSLAQSARPTMIFFVRAARDAASIGPEIRRAVHDVAPKLPVYEMRTMTERTAAATAQARFRAILLTAFALTALSLAVIGIYGVMSFAVAARTREIGVRIALGAEGSRVQRLVIGEGIGVVSVGAIIGLIGALAATRVLRTFLFDLTPSDPVTYVGVVVVLGAAAILASWIPARRASRVDPVVALRAE